MLSVDSSPTSGGTIEVYPGTSGLSEGTIIKLTAKPADGYIFERWAGDVYGITDTSQNPVSFQMVVNRSITAMFAEAPPSSSWSPSRWWVWVIVGIVGFVGLFIVLIFGWLIFFPRKGQLSG